MPRHPQNPIITRADIPAIPPHFCDVSSVFNPGAIRFGDRIALMLRVQNRGRETAFIMAFSEDGIHFVFEPATVILEGLEYLSPMPFHCYDARITRLDNQYWIMFAMDTAEGCCLALAVTEDFHRFEFRGICSEMDVRNGVLFPESIDGFYYRLDRPNQQETDGGVLTGTAIRLSKSTDLLNWAAISTLISGRWHYWDELIGSGPPPLKTAAGWLHVYHGVATHFGAANVYQAGVVLLDLNNPGRVLGRSRQNILEPRELYETTGQVPNVVFPSGMIAIETDEDGCALPDNPVYLYYGAADTCVGLYITTIYDLLQACEPCPNPSGEV